MEAADRYRLAKGAASRAITETKNKKVWEEFGKAGRWSTFEVLNPANVSSCEEAKSKDLGRDLFVSLEEVTELVMQLLSGKASGVDEISPEILKAFDIIGVS